MQRVIALLSKYPPPQLMCVTLINCSEPGTNDMEIGQDVGKKGIREEMGKLLLKHLLSTDLASSLEGFSLVLGQYWTVCPAGCTVMIVMLSSLKIMPT